MSVLDKIRKKQVLSAPETVNADWSSPSVSLDDREGDFSVSLKYDNGAGVDMKVYFQVSNDDLNYGDVEDSEVTITDSEGVVIFDLPGSGTAYARLRIQVTSGSIDVLEIKYVASQRH